MPATSLDNPKRSEKAICKPETKMNKYQTLI